MAAKGALLWIDKSSVNAAIHKAFTSASEKHYQKLENKTKNRSDKLDEILDIHVGGPAAMCRVSPISMAKAIKNHAELEGMRNSHLR